MKMCPCPVGSRNDRLRVLDGIPLGTDGVVEKVGQLSPDRLPAVIARGRNTARAPSIGVCGHTAGAVAARVRRLCANGDRGATGYRWPINDRRSGTAGAPPRPDCSAGIASDLRSCGGCGIRRSACRGRSAGRAARRDGHGRRRDQSVTRFTARSGSTPALTSSS